MKKLIQTRLKNGNQNGNCFPTVIACVMDLDSPEDVLQFQELYESTEISWVDELFKWLKERGWEWQPLRGHFKARKDEYYFVTGYTKRSNIISHVCIYQNGKLVHDPHPDQSGLITEEAFEVIRPIKPKSTTE